MNVLQEVEDWVYDQNVLAGILSQDLYSFTGRWFDFNVDPDGVHILENGQPVERVGDVAEAQLLLYVLCGVVD